MINLEVNKNSGTKLEVRCENEFELYNDLGNIIFEIYVILSKSGEKKKALAELKYIFKETLLRIKKGELIEDVKWK